MGKACLAAGALLLVLSITAYAVLRNYLHSDAFRLFLSAEVSKAAEVSGEFERFRWDGLAVDTAGFRAEGDGLIREVNAGGLHTQIGLSGVRRGVWEIKGSRADRVAVELDFTKRGDDVDADVSSARGKPKVKKSGWLPSDVEVMDVDIRELAVKARLSQGLAGAEGLRVQVSPGAARRSYRAEVRGGRVSLPFKLAPALTIENLKLRYQDGDVFLTHGAAGVFSTGRIEAAGEWNSRARTLALDGGADGIRCEDLLNETWSKRFTGDVSSTFVMQGRDGVVRTHGSAKVENGVLTALPVLDALAAYADTRRFRVLTLDEARTDWRIEKGVTTLSDLVISSDTFFRLEGRVIVRGRELDGSFRLGISPGTLSAIPGAETHVFLPGERGLLWTPLRVTGTLDDPKEDLTERLIAAAGIRMFEQLPETGERVLKFTRSVVGDSPSETVEKGVRTLEKGVEALEKSGDVVREVSGILDGLLGTGSSGKEQPEEEKEEE